MKRSTGFQVRKRDGRMEWLRATKLARSIGRAIAAGRGEDYGSHGLAGEDWRTADLTTAILTGLREQYGPGRRLTTAVLAEAAQQVLVATGFPRAAEEYARVGGEQRRRRLVLMKTMPSLQDGLPLVGPSGASGSLDSGAAGHHPAAQSYGGRRGSGAGGRPARGGRV
jgi:hypothetical protein